MHEIRFESYVCELLSSQIKEWSENKREIKLITLSRTLVFQIILRIHPITNNLLRNTCTTVLMYHEHYKPYKSIK